VTADLVFWLAAALLAYTWVGYPALVAALARLPRTAGGPARPGRSRPRLSVIVAAHNEARFITAKLRSTLTQRYPWDRLEVIVVSDGSTDGTDGLVGAYPDGRVTLVRQEPRAGKSVALNRAVARASGDVLVFTDANALFAPGALVRLAGAFANPRVGLVTGQGLYGDPAAPGHAVGNGYVRYEAWIKGGESALGVVAGADGAIYALRRTLYRDLGPAEINDLLHPIQAALAGQLARFDPGAYTVEPPAQGGGQEFRRQVRMIAQGMALLVRWLPRLVRARRWRAAWALVSHRVLRWLTAPALVAALAANVALVDRHPLYVATLAGQALVHGLALAGLLGERLGVRLGRLSVPYYFWLVSAAGVAGLLRWLGGGAQAIWSPAGQAPAAAPGPDDEKVAA
jgi:cellulose synthase/poly-beta-1,6-N-acetylglucosamine synthase-like glycosyltransferase